jgi:DNA-binding CsgD family transcriptional regulator
MKPSHKIGSATYTRFTKTEEIKMNSNARTPRRDSSSLAFEDAPEADDALTPRRRLQAIRQHINALLEIANPVPIDIARKLISIEHELTQIIDEFRLASYARQISVPVPPTGSEAASRQISARELEVLKLVTCGKPDKQIAAELKVTEHTVHKHISNILAKLGVASRTEAAVIALRDALLGFHEVRIVQAPAEAWTSPRRSTARLRLL